MTSIPKLSIIVTSYNVQDYIAEALESILGQSLGEIEVIVVDDGSSDGTVDIIKSFADLDDRIKPILFEENTIGGVASAANAGLEVATGEYIGFADGDDVYDSEMFGKMYRAAVKHDADLAMCQFMLQNTITGERYDSDDRKNWARIETITPMVLDEQGRKDILAFSPVPWRKIYRGDMVRSRNLRFPVGDYFFEDNPLHWASVLSADSIVLLPEVLCYHRMARPGQTMSNVGPGLFKLFRHHDNIRTWLIENDRTEFMPLLLEWVAKQNAWISERAADEDIGLLLAEIHPIVAQYDDADIQALGFGKEGRTHQMLVAARANDEQGFLQAARSGKKKAPAPSKHSTKASEPAPRVDLEDIYFALMLLQKRLDGLEGKVDAQARATQKLLEAVENATGGAPEGRGANPIAGLLRRMKA
ncbi:glycosyltransferase family 2 protein [Paracoccus sp. 1_MG-2023]|uniref:glycosyltransferase family 2 protein n=1 Tax=unclassified Paracoccus (in: a-proteobacteria) TaxID=2688777 RepID=UPI001C095874|nr:MULTISPECIES: glycosyltransferase family 2 protein [unclassified Paracoccus (in: a-proteobacteria)]MBU2956256.1 glycosyltransferase [Paracoccus sp. C2R09]MDO6667933.1 glycosyltransferase family 2 protein [Paracoccus sp. 1_MG-2023]